MAFSLEAFLSQGLGLGGYRPTKFDCKLGDSEVLMYRINKIVFSEFEYGCISGSLYAFEDNDFSTAALLPKPGEKVPMKINFYDPHATLIGSTDWVVHIDYIETVLDWAAVNQIMSYRMFFSYEPPNLYRENGTINTDLYPQVAKES